MAWIYSACDARWLVSRNLRGVLRAALMLGALALAACANPSGPSGINPGSARDAAVNAYVQALQSTTTGSGTDSGGTYTTFAYSPPGGGSATLVLYNGAGNVGSSTLPTWSGPAGWGRLVFSDYADSASGYTLSGTLAYVFFDYGTTTPYPEYADLSGSISYSGAQVSGSVVLDFLAATTVDVSSRSAPVLSGSVKVGSQYYDIATGAKTGTPTATVSFSPTSGSGLGTISSTLSAPGTDSIYVHGGWYGADWRLHRVYGPSQRKWPGYHGLRGEVGYCWTGLDCGLPCGDMRRTRGAPDAGTHYRPGALRVSIAGH